MPPPVSVRGVEFIEFAASDDEEQALGAMLASLGFTATARHRSKSVTRWQQGDVNIVMNSEPEGLAHSFDSLHGASVCAIGLRVDDTSAALERAAALNIPSFEQAVRPDEMQIPSVLGVGGSLVYFIEDGSEEEVWSHEFPQVMEGPGLSLQQALDLERVDHIAQTMRFEEFLSWLLYYIALFDVTKTEPVEIADTLGLIQSQAVQSPGRELRITLNGSSGAETLSSRFVQHYMGAGVQHIAFETSDIFAAAESAASNGLPILEIPPNYYDDLSARFGLDDELVRRLASLNILFDRDDGAEYLQFYSRAFAKRVFFEIVERRSYDGYGTSNALIRLAAQARFKNEKGRTS